MRTSEFEVSYRSIAELGILQERRTAYAVLADRAFFHLSKHAKAEA